KEAVEMRKSKLALTALMIGTLPVTGATFAEAGLKVDDVKIIVKNNEPMAAIIPIERFSELIAKEELLERKI
ncbi:MAG: hypothetical protein J5365_08935, partial [Erysipelotrichaceae bacterium]|nr:hypothetical protein [Erysipelotrichaceae bacterium]